MRPVTSVFLFALIPFAPSIVSGDEIDNPLHASWSKVTKQLVHWKMTVIREDTFAPEDFGISDVATLGAEEKAQLDKLMAPFVHQEFSGYFGRRDSRTGSLEILAMCSSSLADLLINGTNTPKGQNAYILEIPQKLSEVPPELFDGFPKTVSEAFPERAHDGFERVTLPPSGLKYFYLPPPIVRLHTAKDNSVTEMSVLARNTFLSAPPHYHDVYFDQPFHTFARLFSAVTNPESDDFKKAGTEVLPFVRTRGIPGSLRRKKRSTTIPTTRFEARGPDSGANATLVRIWVCPDVPGYIVRYQAASPAANMNIQWVMTGIDE